jgi:hypothetical protein
VTTPTPTHAALAARWPWRPIPGCPGRAVLRGAATVTPLELAGPDVAWSAHRVATAHDEVLVAPLGEGGLITYRRADGTFVHTLNTPDGFARKLAQLGVPAPPRADAGWRG